jgi:hypothetical protein
MDDGEPDDWPLPHARTLDDLLRCGACRELLHVPMRLPNCAHLFCSTCIRGWMAARVSGGQPRCCPTCRQVRREND